MAFKAVFPFLYLIIGAIISVVPHNSGHFGHEDRHSLGRGDDVIALTLPLSNLNKQHDKHTLYNSWNIKHLYPSIDL